MIQSFCHCTFDSQLHSFNLKEAKNDHNLKGQMLQASEHFLVRKQQKTLVRAVAWTRLVWFCNYRASFDCAKDDGAVAEVTEDTGHEGP